MTPPPAQPPTIAPVQMTSSEVQQLRRGATARILHASGGAHQGLRTALLARLASLVSVAAIQFQLPCWQGISMTRDPAQPLELAAMLASTPMWCKGKELLACLCHHCVLLAASDSFGQHHRAACALPHIPEASALGQSRVCLHARVCLGIDATAATAPAQSALCS